MSAANFALLDSSLPEIDRLIAAMLHVREAVGSRSWSHAQEPTGEEWWADVLTDPRARRNRLEKAQPFGWAREVKDLLTVHHE